MLRIRTTTEVLYRSYVHEVTQCLVVEILHAPVMDRISSEAGASLSLYVLVGNTIEFDCIQTYSLRFHFCSGKRLEYILMGISSPSKRQNIIV